MITWIRRRMAWLFFGVADFVDPNRVANVSVEVMDDGSRVVVLCWGSFYLPIAVDNDDRFALARALTATKEELIETDGVDYGE